MKKIRHFITFCCDDSLPLRNPPIEVRSTYAKHPIAAIPQISRGVYVIFSEAETKHVIAALQTALKSGVTGNVKIKKFKFVKRINR